MKSSVVKRVKALETAREPKEASLADYVIASWEDDPVAAMDKLPVPKKGSLLWWTFYSPTRPNGEPKI